MAKLKLSIQTGDYEIVRALKEGAVEPEGIELQFPKFTGAREIHQQMARGEFDVGEFNAGAYMANKSRGHPVTAIPVYLHRRFRHGFAFINSNKGINKPVDLIGKRIGGTNFAPAGNIWIRGILENDYSVPHRSITWVTDRAEDGDFDYHPDLKIEIIKEGHNLEEMLIAGEIDAMISPNVVQAVNDSESPVEHLFPDYKEVEIDYYKNTGIFPIMHVTTLKEDIYEKNPWAVKSLMDAFEEAKQIAYKLLVNPRIVPLAWYRSAWDEERQLLGDDPWAYGLSDINRKNIMTLSNFVHQQGMTDRLMTVEELFAKEACQ